jgi:uncharacterized protein
MAQETKQDTNQDATQSARGLETIAGVAREAARKGPPPVHLWNPPFCGDLDMRIAADGTWFYLKTPIGRAALVKLFASVLKREGDKYFLVTPVEKCGIVVEDAPFLAVELEVAQGDRGQVLHFRTNVDDWVACGRDHALRFEPEPETGGLKPYLHVRRELWAKVTRALFYDLVELGEERDIGGQRMFGVASAGEFFAMAPADAALREAEEEIGLSRMLIEPIGYLDLYLTFSGYRILPTVARVRPGYRLVLNEAEVADAFEVPLAFLMDAQNHALHSRDWKGVTRKYYAMPFGERYIWGVTAGILRNLYERIYEP